MNKKLLIIALVLIIFSLAITACVDDGSNNANGIQGRSPFVQQTLSANAATATFGAEQFNLQLTAMAERAKHITPIPPGP
ncbi:MAG: hypothetical protein AB1894_20980 [Chloroflexota bacterium]